jgi:pantetheine-phosphate adenylyltransferase
MTRIAIYPGSFDPLTNGHVSIIERGLRIFDEIIVALAVNIRKDPLFSLETRISFLEESFPQPSVSIETFDGLLVEFARSRGAVALLRGLRGVGDFEYELKMAHMNRRLAEEIETVFLMTEDDQSFISSSLIKEVARFGGDVSGTVPAHVVPHLVEAFEDEP